MPQPKPVRGLSKESLATFHKHRPPFALAMPMIEMVPRHTAVNLAQTIHRVMRPDDQLLFTKVSGNVAYTRNSIVEQFLNLPEKYRWLVMIDDDMVWDPDTVEILLGYDVPFMGALCTMKTEPYLMTAYVLGKVDDEGYHYHNVANWIPYDGVKKCDATGAAFICIRRDVLKAMQPPYFWFEGGGEDLYFCRKVKALGHQILVNTDLLVGHLMSDQYATAALHWEYRAQREAEMGAPEPLMDFEGEQANALPDELPVFAAGLEEVL